MFEQVHRPGLLAQSDFTHMESLDITLGGMPFPHLLFHLVLTYSNYEAATLCFSETFEALAEGIETYEELAYLQAATRIRYAQGYYFYKPIFLEDLKLATPVASESRPGHANRPVQENRSGYSRADSYRR